jgi:hypothetical protein
MLYGAIDGTGVTMTAKETAGREGKGEDGRARTREVKLAVFFTQDDIGDDGYPVRDPGSCSYIATFEPAAVFGDLVKAEGIRRGADHVRQLTILGDGAAWIWGIAADKFPEATQIVDLFHAREHLNSLARAVAASRRSHHLGRRHLLPGGAGSTGPRRLAGRDRRRPDELTTLVNLTTAQPAPGLPRDMRGLCCGIEA